jgi:hypothetical protein
MKIYLIGYESLNGSDNIEIILTHITQFPSEAKDMVIKAYYLDAKCERISHLIEIEGNLTSGTGNILNELDKDIIFINN